MSDKKAGSSDKAPPFAPDEQGAAKEDANPPRKPRSLAELMESSDKGLKHVSERLDQLEAQVNAGARKNKSD